MAQVTASNPHLSFAENVSANAESSFQSVERIVVATLTVWFFMVLGLGSLHVFGGLHRSAVGVIAIAETGDDRRRLLPVLSLPGVCAIHLVQAPDDLPCLALCRRGFVPRLRPYGLVAGLVRAQCGLGGYSRGLHGFRPCSCCRSVEVSTFGSR